MYKNILLATDLQDEESNSLLKATQIARQAEGNLIIVHITSAYQDAQFASIPMSSVNDAYEKINANRLSLKELQKANLAAYNQISEALNKKSVNTEVLVLDAVDAAKEITEVLVPYFNIDLVIATKQKKSPLQRLLNGSVTRELSERTSCDLLLINANNDGK